MFTRERLNRYTTALRNNPEQQTSGVLGTAKPDQPVCFCALGKLCDVEEIPFKIRSDFDIDFSGSRCFLPFPLNHEFGCSVGSFRGLGMPNLNEHDSIVDANDRGTPWSVIADHLDAHYPCSDEPPKKV